MRVKEIKHNGNTMWFDTIYLVATPVVSCTNNVVTMTCSTSGATIKYSTNNGSTWQTYSSAITISATTTYKAYATKSGMIDSSQTSYTATYVKPTLPEPTVTKTSQRQTTSSYYVTVQFETSGVSGVTYYYTYSSEGTPSNPTTSSLSVSGTGSNSTASTQLSQSTSSTGAKPFRIKVFGVKSGYNNSSIKSATVYFS